MTLGEMRSALGRELHAAAGIAWPCILTLLAVSNPSHAQSGSIDYDGTWSFRFECTASFTAPAFSAGPYNITVKNGRFTYVYQGSDRGYNVTDTWNGKIEGKSFDIVADGIRTVNKYTYKFTGLIPGTVDLSPGSVSLSGYELVSNAKQRDCKATLTLITAAPGSLADRNRQNQTTPSAQVAQTPAPTAPQPVAVPKSAEQLAKDRFISTLKPADAKIIQSALLAQGLYVGAVDGVWGSASDAAVQAWQTKTGQPKTGIVTAEQLTMLQGILQSAAEKTQLQADADKAKLQAEIAKANAAAEKARAEAEQLRRQNDEEAKKKLAAAEQAQKQAEAEKAQLRAEIEKANAAAEKAKTDAATARANSTQLAQAQQQSQADNQRVTRALSKSVDRLETTLGEIILPISERDGSWFIRVASIPIQQQQFCRIVDKFYEELIQISTTRNAIRRNMLFRDRQADLAALLPNGSFENWVVRVIEVTQALDGNAAVLLQLPCRAMIGSDACSANASEMRATIAPETPMYRELTKLKEGDYVAVSGSMLYAAQKQSVQPLPLYAAYSAGSYCSTYDGTKDQDVFVTQVRYLIHLR